MQYIQQNGEVVDLFKEGQVVIYKEEVLDYPYIAEFVREMQKNGDRLLVIEDQKGDRVRVKALSGSERDSEWNSLADRLKLAETTGLEGAVKLV